MHGAESRIELAFLGRWAARASTDTDVRTAMLVMENLQLFAARHARALAHGGVDLYIEEHILRELLEFLLKAGEPREIIQDILNDLTLPDFSAKVVALEDVAAAVTAEVEAPSPTEPARSDNEADEDGADYDGEEEDEKEDKAAVELAELHAASLCVVEAAAEKPHGFVVSKAKRGRFRRLHHVEACRLIPGVHYKSFDVWGDVCPPEGEIDAVCSICLQGSRPGAVSALPSLEESVDSDSSSSSTGSANAAKRQRLVPPAPEPRALADSEPLVEASGAQSHA